MKLKHRALSLLLTLAMVLTFMPAMAFASGPDDVRKPIGISYEGSKEYEPSGTYEDGETFEANLVGFHTPGNKITITWDKEPTTEVFECKGYEVKGRDGDTWTEYGYFAEGVTPKIVVDNYGDEVAENDTWFEYSVDDDGNAYVGYNYEYSYEDEEGYNQEDSVFVKDEFKAIKVVSLEYEGPAAVYEPWGGPRNADPCQEGAKINIVYSDGSKKTTVCKKWGTETNEDGYTWDQKDYFFENDEPDIKEGIDGDGDHYKYADNAVWFDFDYSSATAAGMPFEYRGVKGLVPVAEKQYAKPTSIEFIPADPAFAADVLIGQTYIYSDMLGGEGNKLVVKYSDGTERVCEYKSNKEYPGFYYVNEYGQEEEFYVYLNVKAIKKGTTSVTGTDYVWVDGYQESVPLKVTVPVKTLNQYYAYVEYKTYEYSGKKITPKVVVKYFTGSKFKTMPKSWYTCKVSKKTNVGSYNLKVTVKSKYRKKYGKYLYGWYEINPKKPVIKKATAGTGKITVTWTKFTSKQQKGASGIFVDYSETKDFRNFGRVQVKKSASKATITGLEKGQKYYVRVVAYKDIKGSYYQSKPSKVKYATVK